MESISVAMSFDSATCARAFKLSATVSILLLLLPSLIFSLLILGLFSLVLFLLIACMFAAIFICSSVFVRIPLMPLLRKSLEFAFVFHAPLAGIGVAKGDLTVENSPVCLVFDRSEVPFEEEGTEGETEGEEEESIKNYGEVRENPQLVQMEDENSAQENWLSDIKISHKNWGRLPSFSSRNSHEIHGFHGILAFWRKKESEEAAEAP